MPWIQMKTMKNLKTSLEPLQHLNLLNQYFLVIKDQQQALKDQLFLTTLLMKKVINIVRRIKIQKGSSAIQISTF